jgi:tRNA(Ile2) C34 agmatinyltransferase TiaS
MKTFKQFLSEKKKLKQLAGQIANKMAAKEAAKTAPIIDFGHSKPNSPERNAAIAAMMGDYGAKAVKAQVANRNRAAMRQAKKELG